MPCEEHRGDRPASEDEPRGDQNRAPTTDPRAVRDTSIELRSGRLLTRERASWHEGRWPNRDVSLVADREVDGESRPTLRKRHHDQVLAGVEVHARPQSVATAIDLKRGGLP